MKGETTMRENAQIYHNQAEVDLWAKQPDDLTSRIIETTMDAILDAYNEFMQDLLAESQEAY